MQNSSLVRPLFAGPIDVIGDIHGEIDALRNLLDRLGYSDDGNHAAGRRLVFLGDLTDRGPDSPAVVELVRALVESGRAQCVLGNHDLNILLGDIKFDNWWFFGEEYAETGSPTPQRVADDATRESVTSFFRTLPLALERADVRVVHACWKDEVVALARAASDALELHEHHKRIIETNSSSQPGLDEIDRGLAHQNQNPVKVLTSGMERRIDPPFFASGKWRYEERVPWWEDYQDSNRCIFGHYSHPHRHGRAVCVDYGVAKRWTERLAPDFNGSFRHKLGALRLPENEENEVVFDGI
jgi:hypothetical protein